MNLPVLFALAITVIVTRLVYAKMREFVKRHGVHNIAGRAITMRPLHGKYQTDATFWSQSKDRASGKSGGRHHRSGLHNLSMTLTVLGGFVAFIYGYFTQRVLTLALTASTVFLVLVAVTVIGVQKARKWHRNKTLINPLALAAETIIDPDRSLGTRTSELISMERDWLTRKRGELGRMTLPDAFHANEGQQLALENLISARLPVSVKFSWQTSKMPQMIRILAAPALPRLVKFRDYLPQIEALKPGEFGLGIDVNEHLYVESHNGDTPWTARSMNSGTGKSIGFKVIVAQIAHKDPDARIVCIDTKQVSFSELRGIRGVEIYDDPMDMDSIWRAFYKLAETMRERYTQLKADPTAIDHMNDIWLFIDEGNDLAVQLKAYYQQEKRNPGDPANPSIWLDAIAPLVWQGRQVKIRGTFALQNLMERYVGGVNLRPSFNIIGMAGYKPNQWRTIIGTTPIPKLQTGPGRMCMVHGTDERWIQGFYDDPEYLREYAEINRKPTGDNNLAVKTVMSEVVE
jgi:hypothetical protein